MRYLLCLLLLCSAASAAPFEWVPASDTQWARLDLARPVGNRQVGCYDSETELYTPLNAGEWGASEDIPEGMELPAGCKRPCRPRHPTGVVWSKTPKDEHVYLRGKEISKEDAMIMLGAPNKVPDDKDKPRITVIGSKEKCAGPLSIAKKHAEFISEEYRPEFWAIQRQGFKTSVDPTIYIQDPKGGTYRRLDGYKGDTEFETVINDVLGRKIGPQPNNDPKKDPGWKRFLPSFPDLTTDVPWIAIGVIVVLLTVAIIRRKEKL